MFPRRQGQTAPRCCPLEDPLAEEPMYSAAINRHLQDDSPTLSTTPSPRSKYQTV
jgi:hypothetical protein